jgi:S1-C subfamily serine protease
MKGSCRVSVAIAIVTCMCSVESYGEYRTWRAASGKYSADAEFVAMKPGNVVSIRLKDGAVRDISLDKLCEADRTFVQSQSAEPTVATASRRQAAGPMQPVEKADKALKAVDKEAQHCRTAEAAVVLYSVFLSDETLPPSTRSAAEAKKAEWQQMADKGLVRTGHKWATPEAVRTARLKSGFLVSQGLEMIRLGQDQLGFDKLMEASSTAPDDIYADFIMATVYAIGQHKFDKAHHHYLNCLRREPANPAVLNNLALTEIKVGSHHDAVQHWKAAAALCDDPRIAQNLGILLNQASKKKILVSKAVLQQISDVYASLVIARKVSVAQSQIGWGYMLIPQEPPPDEKADAILVDPSADSVINVCGTGFVISDTYVLTTRTSTKGAVNFMIADPIEKGKHLPAQLVASSKDSDLALIKCPDLKSRPMAMEVRIPHVGDDILVAGYPLADISGLNLKSAMGIALVGGTVGRNALMTYEAAGSPSVPGGPVTDSMGNVVAMHWKASVALNNRYGAGIPMATALPFVKSSILDFQPPARGQVDVPWSEITKVVEQATVVVLAKTPAQDVGLSKRVGAGFLVDPYCCRCNGLKTIHCQEPNCINGKVASVRTDITGRDPLTGDALTESSMVSTPCQTCGGTQRVNCPACGGSGIDVDLQVPSRSNAPQGIAPQGIVPPTIITP